MRPELPCIFIVEDNGDDLLLIQRAFRKANLHHPITTVKNGEEAVAYLSGQGAYADRSTYPLPALVLLDVRLPRKSGLEVLEWIREQTSMDAMPVVMLTSGATGDVHRARAAGATGLLVKPVYADRLRQIMATINLAWNHYAPATDPRDSISSPL